MKKLLLAVIFSLLALAPFNRALAQTPGSSPDARAVEKSAAVASSPTDEHNREPATQAAAGNASAKNHATASTAAVSPETNSDAVPKAALEAQKNFDTGLTLYNSGKLA